MSAITPATRKRYHHGDLYAALVSAGVSLLATDGLEGVSLRAVARLAGVSHSAPYHHFTNKAALVEALAVEGHRRLLASLTEARAEGSGTAMQALLRVGVSYVEFALGNPGLFQLMNRPELRGAPQGERSPLSQAAQAAYQVLKDGILAGQTHGEISGGDPEILALTAWSTVHGLAMLLLDGMVDASSHGRDLPTQVAMALGLGLLARDNA